MSELVEIGVDGMKLDVNAHAGNGLRWAMNVVFRKPGVAEPRPGFSTNTTAITGTRAVKMLPAGSALDTVTVTPSGGEGGPPTEYHIANKLTGTNFTTSDSADLFFATDAHVFSAESRNNQYYSVYGGTTRTASGIRGRVHGASSLVLAGYGGSPPRITVARAAGTTPAVSSGAAVAYRWTLENKLGEVLRVSQPSMRTVFASQGATADVDLTVYLPAHAVAGDIARIYRSPEVASPVTPSDQLFQLYVRELSSTDISTGSFTFADDVAETALQAALYTNPECGGILVSNYRPPAAKTIDEYQGSVLFGNTAQPHRISLAIPIRVDRTGQATGIGYRDTTGTITGLGAATVTLATTTGLKIGMILSDVSGWTGTGPVRITNIAGGTLTLSHTYAGASGSFVGKRWYDSIRVSCADGSGEDRYFPLRQSTSPSGYFSYEMFTHDFEVSDATFGTTRMACAYAYEVGTRPASGSGLLTDVIVEKYQPGGAPLEIWATHGDEYDPPLPEPTVADGEESVADVWEDAVYWSKRNEPEHVPLLNYARVGALGSPILRMLRGQNCVWIFKADGVFRLSGFGERSGFRVDPVYPDLILRTPGSADQMNGTVYANTNNGVVAFSGGEQPRKLSEQIAGYLQRCDEYMGSANETTASCTFITCNPQHDELILGVSTSDTVSNLYVFNGRSQAWSRWGSDNNYNYDGYGTLGSSVSCAAIHPDNAEDGRLWLGDGVTASLAWRERLEQDGTQFVDFPIGFTGLASSGFTVFTYATCTNLYGSYTIRRGDHVIDAAGNRFVVVDESAGTFTINGVASSAVVTMYSSFVSALQWNARGAGHPGAVKQWSSGAVLFGQMTGVAEWSWRTRSDTAIDDYTTAMEETYDWRSTAIQNIVTSTVVPSNSRRVWTHRDNARCSTLFPEFIICQGDARWQVLGITLTARPVGTRVARRVNA